MATQVLPLNTALLETWEHDVPALERDLLHQDLPIDFALAVIAEHARVLTQADGAAIALGREPAVCRAKVGFAPAIGVKLRPESGLSGECLRTGRVIHCPDTLKDCRVNAIAAGEQKIRSVLVVPITSKGHVSGLLEVLSFNPDRWNQQEIAVLLRLAELIARLSDDSECKDKGSAPNPSMPRPTEVFQCTEGEKTTAAAVPAALIDRATITPPPSALAAVAVLIRRWFAGFPKWLRRAIQITPKPEQS